MIASTSDSHILLYDTRQLSTPIYSVPFPCAKDAVHLDWNQNNFEITINCGSSGVLRADLTHELQLEMIQIGE